MEENEITNEAAEEVLGSGEEVSADAGREDVPDAEEEFGKLIKGKYKDAYAKRTQSMINRRFREVKELENIRSLAADALGVEDTTDAVTSALARSREHKEERGARDARAGRDVPREALGVVTEYERMMAEAAEVKKIYPSFDAAREAENPLFAKLVADGVDMKSAYEALHHDSIVEGAMMLAARRVADAARRAQVQSPRPGEGASSPSPAVDPRLDVRSMSADDVRRILKRAEMGEKIRF